MTTEQLARANEITKEIEILRDHAEQVERRTLNYKDELNNPVMSIGWNNMDSSLRLKPQFLPMPIDAQMNVYLFNVDAQIKKLQGELAAL
ncbi:MAG TPA: hypothetical protein DCG24_06875 [Bacteroidetes bacterium]|nr:hypothetical protein [Bacteroidota bacterium]HQU40247.1 hypothetical protein [Chitinophagales bacterium]